jgi:hypothetical protein
MRVVVWNISVFRVLTARLFPTNGDRSHSPRESRSRTGPASPFSRNVTKLNGSTRAPPVTLRLQPSTDQTPTPRPISSNHIPILPIHLQLKRRDRTRATARQQPRTDWSLLLSRHICQRPLCRQAGLSDHVSLILLQLPRNVA